MKKVIRIDVEGFYIEDVLLNPGDETPEDCTEIACQDGFYLPRLVEGAWVEGKIDPEI